MAATRQPDSNNQPAPDSYGGMEPGSSNARAVRNPDTPDQGAQQRQQEQPAADQASAQAAGTVPDADATDEASAPTPAKARRRPARPAAGTKKRK